MIVAILLFSGLGTLFVGLPFKEAGNYASNFQLHGNIIVDQLFRWLVYIVRDDLFVLVSLFASFTIS